MFNYEIWKSDKSQLILTATSTQVFLDKHNELSYISPDFFEKWKNKWLV